MANCKTTNEVLKNIRELGGDTSQLKAARSVLDLINKALVENNTKEVDPEYTIKLKNAYRDTEISVETNGTSLPATVNWLIGYRDGSTKVSITMKNGKEYVPEVGINGKSKNHSMYIPALDNAMKLLMPMYDKEYVKEVFTEVGRLNYVNPLVDILVKEFDVKLENEDISADLVAESLVEYGYKVLDGKSTHMFNSGMVKDMLVEAKYVAETNTVVYPGTLNDTSYRLNVVVDKMFKVFEKEKGKVKSDKVKDSTKEDIDRIISKAVASRRKSLRDRKEVLKPEVLLHELGHVLTENYLLNNSESEVVNELDVIRLSVTDVLMKNKDLAENDTYWQTSLEEFISEALSNPTLIKELSKIPVKDIKNVDTVLQAIVKFVAGLFGTKYENNVYDAIMYRLSQIADEQGKTESGKVIRERAEVVKDVLSTNYSSEVVKTVKTLPREYYNTLNKIVRKIIGPKVSTSEYLAFSKAVLDNIAIVGGQYAKSKVLLSKRPRQAALEAQAQGIFEQWYLNESPYGLEYQNIEDPQDFVDALAKDEIYKGLKERLAPIVKKEMIEGFATINGVHTLAHELVHVGSIVYMKENPDSELTKFVKDLYTEAVDNKEDILRFMGEGRNTYWTNSVEEFIAEGLSNPDLVNALMHTKSKLSNKYRSNTFRLLVDKLLAMLGTKEESTYTYLLNGYLAMIESLPHTKSIDPNALDSIVYDMKKSRYEKDILGSNEDILNKAKKSTFDKFKKLEEDIHGNPDKMLDLIDMLEAAEGNLTDSTHLEYLKDTIKSLNPKYLTKMSTYVMENAKETGGVVTTDSIGIMIGKTKSANSNSQTAAEVYVHEVIHAYTRFAIEMARSGDQQARKIYRELQHAMVVAKKDTKWQDFLGKKEVDSTEDEQNVAKEMYKYIFDSERSEEEFTAHALTNPLVMAKLKRVPLTDSSNKTVWESIKSNFNALIGWILGEVSFKNKNKDVYRATTELVMRLGELNNRKVNELRQQESIVDRLADMLDNADDKASELLFKFLEKISPNNELLGEKPDNAIGKTQWYAKALGKMIFNGDYRKHLLTYLDIAGLVDMRGTLSSIINDLIAQDETQKAVDWLGLRSDKHDQNRMNIISTTKDLVSAAFSKKLTKAEEEDITEVLVDTDVQSISDKYGVKGIRRMLENSDVLEKNIAKARNRLKELDKKNANWHLNQASGLGYYLATGKAHIAQNINSKNIAKGMLGLNRKRGYSKVKGDLESAIDEVATLTALRYTDGATKGRVAKLMLEESEGIKTVFRYGQYLKEEARKTIFKGQEAFMVKGYTKELFADNLELEAVPMSKAAEMEAKGYTFVKELENHSLVTTKEKYGLFKTEMFGLQEWNRTATRLTKMHRKGTSLEEIYYEESSELGKKKHLINVKKINIERMKLAKQMEDGEINLEELEYGLSPMIDQYGEITSYRYMMPKKEKRDLLEQDLRVSEVFAATRGAMVDKLESIEHNKKVLELIKEDAAANYITGQTIGKDGSVYVLITENSSDEKIQELWKILPKDFKQEAYRNQEGGLPVRKDLINNLFGYRHLTFANFPGLEKIMPQMLKNAIQIAEAIWTEFIKITKVDILVKMPFVLVGNILSNMIFALTSRMNPLELAGMYRESLRDVKAYLKTHKEWIKLKELEGLGKLSVAEKKTINMLEKQLRESPIHEMYEKGLYQAIVEDASSEELSATNKLKKWYNEKTSNVPKVIKDGMNWAYLTEETQYYKFMTEVLQISDLLARDVERKKLDIVNKKQANGQSKLPMWYIQHLKETDDKYGSIIKHRANVEDRKRILDSKEKEYFKKLAEEYKWNYLLNAFINYNKSSGPAEEYLNRMGFIMFTKYAKRIQRVISETGTKYPLKSLLVLLGDNLVYDADTIQDQSVFTRSWYNMTPQYPWGRVLDVMTPPIVQSSTYQII